MRTVAIGYLGFFGAIILGAGYCVYAKTTMKPPIAIEIVCGTPEMEKQVAQVLPLVASAVSQVPMGDVALAAVEQKNGTDVYLCSLQRSTALAAGLGGPQYPEASLLKENAKRVQANVKKLLSKRSVVFVPAGGRKKRP